MDPFHVVLIVIADNLLDPRVSNFSVVIWEHKVECRVYSAAFITVWSVRKIQ